MTTPAHAWLPAQPARAVSDGSPIAHVLPENCGLVQPATTAAGHMLGYRPTASLELTEQLVVKRVEARRTAARDGEHVGQSAPGRA